MKRVLIVSPHYPPVNAPDLHRVRLSLPYYQASGWLPVVLACEPDPVTAQVIDPLLEETLPSGVPATRIKPSRPWLGVRSLALRSWRQLAKEGDRLLATGDFDLVFFSTTQFLLQTLGPRWLRKFGVPFVCDLQDPWLNTFYDRHPEVSRPGGWKHHLVQWLDARMEGRTLAHAVGLISVSPAYPAELDSRYPALRSIPRLVLPFGADERDWQPAASPAAAQNLFTPASGVFHISAVGRGGDDLVPAVNAIARALLLAGHQAGPGARKPSLQLIGTTYAPQGKARPVFKPDKDIAHLVSEHPARVGYFTALRCLRESDAVLVLGSHDGAYQPSKLHTALSSGRPLIAVVWSGSQLASAVQNPPSIFVLELNADGHPSATTQKNLVGYLASLLRSPPTPLPPPCHVDPAFHARELTRRQCIFFDQLVP